MKIIGHTVEKLEDPFGLLTGERYEFFLDLEVDEEDELYSEKGVGLRVLFGIEENQGKIINYHFYEKGNDEVLDFALEEDEENMVLNYCKANAIEK
ncbi:DUF6509 family protein [Neobacillus thermocopriae]|uniref:Pullulanase n=1 Tax=Neobacillus thermocopriae TaxID=1215031 RepID=A0A6B3TQT6_9BACI|nr:DUF6509 family protein [Neobacillus thermocopriae]MED3625444.1 DUF6509 family protein [Neobacillus thermocopriae]MED3714639.1 DUF6509 family protein [Neobacillus thermocopriae]NEX78918.1 pullulanase [Neobacillus thermocopriae]